MTEIVAPLAGFVFIIAAFWLFSRPWLRRWLGMEADDD